MEGIIVLLGAPNDQNGNLSVIATARCEQAIREYRANPGYKILPTGGYGLHFNVTDKPHAFYTRRYLMSHGIPAVDILEFAESSNTVEDAQLARPVVERYGVKRIIVVTSDYHLRRAQYVFEQELAGVELAYSGCVTLLPKDELRALQEHEERALAKLMGQNDGLKKSDR